MRLGRILQKKAQISMEYLVVVGISLFLITPMVFLFYQQSSSLEDDITATQLEKIGLSLIGSAEEVYYLGSPTQKQLVLYFPDGLNTLTFNQSFLLFNYTSLSGSSELFFSSPLDLNLVGSLKIYPGKHTILVTATESNITFSDAS